MVLSNDRTGVQRGKTGLPNLCSDCVSTMDLSAPPILSSILHKMQEVFHSLPRPPALMSPTFITHLCLVEGAGCTIRVKAAFQRIEATIHQITLQHGIICRDATIDNKWAIVSTAPRKKKINWKLNKRQFYKPGISSGNPSSEKWVPELNSRKRFLNISETKMIAGEVLEVMHPLKLTLCLFCLESPGLYLNANINQWISAGFIFHIFLRSV